MSTDQVVDKLVRDRRRSRSTILFACPEALPRAVRVVLPRARGAARAPRRRPGVTRLSSDRPAAIVVIAAPDASSPRLGAVPPDRYLPSPNNLSVAVIRPIVGFALQYSPSFLALETNLSVSMTGGSFSSL
jgi:hypothetical protein